jgi:hypothetical protein
MAVPDKYLGGGGTGVLYTDRRVFYIEPQVVKELWPAVTPFTTLASNRNMKTGLADPLFKQFEHRSAFINQYCQQNDATPTTIPNDDTGAAVTIDGIVNLPSSSSQPTSAWIGLVFEFWDSTKTTRRGAAVVTAVSGANLTMKSLGGAFATGDDDYMYVIGNAQGEGASSPDPWSDEVRVVWGSTQQFRTPVQVTGTLLQASLRGYSNELERLRMEKSKEHRMHIERALLFGNSKLGTNLDPDNAETWQTSESAVRTDASGSPIRTTMGIITAIETYGSSDTTLDKQNIFTINEATYNYKNFVDDMEKVFQYIPNNGVKTAFVGAKMLSYWSKLDQASGFFSKTGFKVQMSPTQSGKFGFDFRELTTPHGQLNLVYTPALRGPRAGYMVCTTDENLSLMQYRASMYKTNIKTDNAPDLVKDEWHDDLGVGMTLIETHNLFKLS